MVIICLYYIFNRHVPLWSLLINKKQFIQLIPVFYVYLTTNSFFQFFYKNYKAHFMLFTKLLSVSIITISDIDIDLVRFMDMEY